MTTDFIIAGLVPYSTYSVEVLARNSIGFGVPQNRTIRTAESGESSFIGLLKIIGLKYFSKRDCDKDGLPMMKTKIIMTIMILFRLSPEKG